MEMSSSRRKSPIWRNFEKQLLYAHLEQNKGENGRYFTNKREAVEHFLQTLNETPECQNTLLTVERVERRLRYISDKSQVKPDRFFKEGPHACGLTAFFEVKEAFLAPVNGSEQPKIHLNHTEERAKRLAQPNEVTVKHRSPLREIYHRSVISEGSSLSSSRSTEMTPDNTFHTGLSGTPSRTPEIAEPLSGDPISPGSAENRYADRRGLSPQEVDVEDLESEASKNNLLSFLEDLQVRELQHEPPKLSNIRECMVELDDLIADAVRLYAAYMGTISFRLHRLVKDDNAYELTRTLFGGSSKSDTLSTIRTLLRHHDADSSHILTAYIAAAVVNWVLCTNLKSRWEATNHRQREAENDIRSAFSPKICEILEKNWWRKYVDEVIKPEVGTECRVFQERLDSLVAEVTTAYSEASPIEPGSRMGAFVRGASLLLQWRSKLVVVFKTAFDLRLRLEKSSRDYLFTFPSSLEDFQPDSMTSLERAPLGESRRVFLCLRPAISLLSRNTARDRMDSGSPELILSACVLLWGPSETD